MNDAYLHLHTQNFRSFMRHARVREGWEDLIQPS